MQTLQTDNTDTIWFMRCDQGISTCRAEAMTWWLLPVVSVKGGMQQTQKGQSVWVFVSLHLEIRQSITPSSLLRYMNDKVRKASVARSEHITADCMCTWLHCKLTMAVNQTCKLNNHAPTCILLATVAYVTQKGQSVWVFVFLHLKSGSRSLPHHCQK